MSSVYNKFELPVGESSEKYLVGIFIWSSLERSGIERFGSWLLSRGRRLLRGRIEESMYGVWEANVRATTKVMWPYELMCDVDQEVMTTFSFSSWSANSVQPLPLSKLVHFAWVVIFFSTVLVCLINRGIVFEMCFKKLHVVTIHLPYIYANLILCFWWQKRGENKQRRFWISMSGSGNLLFSQPVSIPKCFSS